LLAAMRDALDRFLADASSASGMGFVPRARRPPIVVLVVDDSDDPELASSLSGGEGVAATDYDGSWSARVDDTGLVVKFLLARRDGGWERRWTYADPGGSVINAITAGAHHVAIVPLIGDLSDFVREGLGGAILVDVPASESIAAALERVAVPTTAG
jgi:hypothetical protein